MVGAVPSPVHQSRCQAPPKLPMAKNGSATAPTALPLPAFTSVPEPQPSTTCIAAPNTKAPPIIARPMGACAPFNSAPFDASNGKAASATIPMQINCAISPEASRSRIIRRHGPVKPKRNPSSAKPKPRPISSTTPKRGPARSATASTSAPTTRIMRPRDSPLGVVSAGAAAVAVLMIPRSVLAGDLVDHVAEQPRHIGHLVARIRPADHGFRVHAHAVDPRHFAQREPVGRGPVAGIAKRHQLVALLKAVLGGQLTDQLGLDARRLVLTEPAIMREIARLRQGAGHSGGSVLGVALPELLGAGVDQFGLLLTVYDRLHVFARGQPFVRETDRDLARGHARGL